MTRTTTHHPAGPPRLGRLNLRRSWLDRALAPLAPQWALKRERARVASALLERAVEKRHYEASSVGRRTAGWRKSGGDANAVIGPALNPLRATARDLVRNNPYASSALATIADHAVGTGIVPSSTNAKAMDIWRRWAETTACDADGRNDIYGLQKLIMRTVPESGEVLVRRRIRRPSDGLPIPLQLQILDPDFLDTTKDVQTLANGGRIVQGVEFDAIGRRVAYHLHKEHPGSFYGTGYQTAPIPASEILHIFRSDRPGQVRGPSWFSPTTLRFKDFDELEDAVLMKQKIAACLAVLMTDPDGTNERLGPEGDQPNAEVDMLEPGIIKNLPPGKTIQVVNPPQVQEYPEYAKTVLRAIATGLGLTYEDLTGDYAEMPFSAARMSRLRHWARVEDWRWRLMVPQLCIPVWAWMIEMAGIMNLVDGDVSSEWTAPPMPMVDPVNEGLAYQRNIRNGIQTHPEVLRERGYNPTKVLAEIVDWNRQLDAADVVLDSDPRRTTQAGQLQGTALAAIVPNPGEDE